ncbi:MAG TPA: GntR family transcriptional regulator, partial [Myxococcaceae bacterium]|nr:GntR family transcriptional regulator [Myxococcaceae bacterium]
LERMIVSGMLPEEGGVLPSEQMLARHHGVSRATVREALLRLAARGLVVQHPGRRTRAVPVGQAVSLENLGLLLNGRGGSLDPGGRRMLEGYFALKRDVTVELLAACCEHASDRDLDRLLEACFALREEARWQEDGRRWVALDFELLRLAAAAAGRPDAYLLVQSLERAWLGIARRVVPLLDAEATGQWALCAFHALGARDAQALKRELLPLVRASDERVLGRLAPPPEADDTPEAPRAVTQSHSVDTSSPESEEGPGSNLPNRSGCQTGLEKARPPSAPPPESPSTGGDCPPEQSALGASEPERRAEVSEEAESLPGPSSVAAPGLAPGLPRVASPPGAQPTGIHASSERAPRAPSSQPSSSGGLADDAVPPRTMREPSGPGAADSPPPGSSSPS